MKEPTVYAVVKITLEVPVRASSGKETLESMHAIAEKEARASVANAIRQDARIIECVFSHAVVKVSP